MEGRRGEEKESEVKRVDWSGFASRIKGLLFGLGIDFNVLHPRYFKSWNPSDLLDSASFSNSFGQMLHWRSISHG
jgi:hypothetical protein